MARKCRFFWAAGAPGGSVEQSSRPLSKRRAPFVMQLSNPMAFCFSGVETIQTRPRLKLGDQGLIEVVGGLRQLSDDVPSPDQLSEVREHQSGASSILPGGHVDKSREPEPSAVTPEKPLSDKNQLPLVGVEVKDLFTDFIERTCDVIARALPK